MEFPQVVPSVHLKEYLIDMQMLRNRSKEKPAGHAAHQEMKANLLFELGQEWESTREDNKKRLPIRATFLVSFFR